MDIKRFVLTEDHIKLLRHTYMMWWDCEYGAPAIDPKRPYGNSDVERDIHSLLTGQEPEELSSTERENYRRLHEETEVALEIILRTGSFVPGVYERVFYPNRDWKRVDVRGD